MRDRAKSIPPISPAQAAPLPEPDPRPGRNPDPPPVWENDRAIRFTWLRGFDEQHRAAAMEALGELLIDYGREGGLWGTASVPKDLLAVAEDLESISLYLLMVEDGIGESVGDEADEVFGRWSVAWAEQLRAMVEEIRATAGGPPPREAE